MALYHLLRGWLLYAGKEQVMQAAGEAARQYMQNQASQGGNAPETPPVKAGLVFALPQEMGCFEDRLTNVVRTRGNKLAVVRGELRGEPIVAVQAGVGQAAAAHATEALILGHAPAVVISAGFCGGLDPKLQRNHLLLANEVVQSDGERFSIPLKLSSEAGGLASLHVGRLQTVDTIIRTAEEKAKVRQQHQALAVDMETAAVMAVCREREVPFLSVRVVSDTASETLPPEIFHLVQQPSTAGRLGAAVGALFRRPSSIKDLYRLKENALVAADTLAKFLDDVISELLPNFSEEQPQGLP